MGRSYDALGHCQDNGDYLLSELLPAKGRSDFAELFAPAGPSKTDKNTLYLVALTVPMSLIEASEVSGQSVGALKISVHRAIKALRLRVGISE